MEYAKSKEFHRTLHKCWGTALKADGYKRCKHAAAGYYRTRRDGRGYLRFWAQASQWGDSWSGNSFTLNIDTRIADPHSPLGGSDRCLQYLTDQEMQDAEAITARIYSRKPKPAEGHWIYELMTTESKDKEFWSRAFQRAFEYKHGLIRPGCDFWLAYFSVHDVELWGEFLLRALPSLLDRCESRVMPLEALRNQT
jgi:hypothetical protein